jgi:hypothetical protein
MQFCTISAGVPTIDQSSFLSDLLLFDPARLVNDKSSTLGPSSFDGLDPLFGLSDEKEGCLGLDSTFSAVDHDRKVIDPLITPEFQHLDIESKRFDVLAVISDLYPRYNASIAVPKFVRKSYKREKRLLNATPVVLLDSPNFHLISCNLSLVDTEGEKLPFAQSNTASKTRVGSGKAQTTAGIDGSMKTVPDLQLATFEPFCIKGDFDQFHFRFRAVDSNNREILAIDGPLSTAKSKIGINLLRKNLLISGKMFAMQFTNGNSVVHLGTNFKLYSSWSPMCIVLLSDLAVLLKMHDIELSQNCFIDIPYAITHSAVSQCEKLKRTIKSGDLVILVDLTTYTFIGPLNIFKSERRGICTSLIDICFRDKICFRSPKEDFLSFQPHKGLMDTEGIGELKFSDFPSPLQIIEMIEEKLEFYSPLASFDLTVFPHIRRVSTLSDSKKFTIYGQFPQYNRNFWVFVGRDPVKDIDFGVEECVCSLSHFPRTFEIYLVSNATAIVLKLPLPLVLDSISAQF